MEAIIMMIIIGLISSLFNKKGEQKKKSKSMPPFSNPKAPTVPQHTKTERPKSLEDFANEIFGQLTKKQVQVDVAEPVLEPTVETVQKAVRPASTRPPLEERPLVKKLKHEPAFQVVPKTQQQVMQAVVMAEILGKPKAKR